MRHLRRLYDDLGIIQIDPINVLARAHHQVAMSRLGPYDRDTLDTWMWRSGEVFEGWVHVDATSTVDTWPLFAHRRADTPAWRAAQAIMDTRPAYLEQVLEEIAERGELSAAQLRDPGERLGSWGSRSMGRAALDYHHHRGRLAISFRDSAMTAYFDLVERVIPRRWLDAPVPEAEQAERALLSRAVGLVGVGTVDDLADHHRQHRPTARRLLAEMAADGEVAEVEVRGWAGPCYADPELAVPRRVDACTLLNPFDPVMWHRPRVARLFDLDYTVEIYVPKDQRRYGYYVLPLLLGDQLRALVDLKLDRRRRVLVVAAAHHLPPTDDAARGRGRLPAAGVAAHLRTELDTWAGWLGADDVEVADAGDLAALLR